MNWFCDDQGRNPVNDMTPSTPTFQNRMQI